MSGAHSVIYITYNCINFNILFIDEMISYYYYFKNYRQAISKIRIVHVLVWRIIKHPLFYFIYIFFNFY